MTLRKRPSQILLLSLTIFSLFVSAVSACACSHHQPEISEEAVSCHTSKHKAPSAKKDEVQMPRRMAIGVDCECRVRLPVLAISAKIEKKTFQAADEADTILLTDFEGPTAISVGTSSVISFERFTFLLSPPELFSGPSRAPPRL